MIIIMIEDAAKGIDTYVEKNLKEKNDGKRI